MNAILLLALPFCLFLLFAGARGNSQSSADQKPQGQPQAETLHVTSRLVHVNVIVRHKGAPVTGLTKADFTVLDLGQPQEIADFSEQIYNPDIAAVAAANRPDANAIFTNKFDSHAGTPSSVTVILVDALNTPPQEMANARAQLVSFLHHIRAQDHVALYGLSDNLYVLHDFSSDAASLLASLDHLKRSNAYQPSASEVEPSGLGNDNLDQFLDAANQHAADIQTINRAEMTANVIAAIANSLIRVPGRKNLVWLSGGFPFQIGTGSSADDPGPFGQNSSGSSSSPNSSTPNSGSSPNNSKAPGADNSVQFRVFQKEIEAAAEAVNNANLAIYPVDARGLIGAPNFSATAQNALPSSSIPSRRNPRPTAGSMPTPPRENFDTMIELAARTGGRAFYNTNDIENSIQTAIDDSLDSYELDYYLSDAKPDSTFHTIKVEVKRPGVEVRFRRGYFAVPDASSDPLRVQRTMEDAMASPFQDTDLALTVEARPGNAAGTREVSLILGIDSARMRFQQAGEDWNSEIQVVWLQFNSEGKLATGLTQKMTVTLSPASYEEIKHTSVKVLRNVPLKNDAVKLRIVLRAISTGAVGSVDIPLQKVFSQPAAPPAN